MNQVLQLGRPVEYGDLTLAPTTELAGIAELSLIGDHDRRLDAIVRIARAVAEEDAERDRIAELHRPDAPVVALPTRR